MEIQKVLEDFLKVFNKLNDQVLRISEQNTCLSLQITNIEKRLNKVNSTDKGPCPYCRENFITYQDHDFCGSCGMALNR